MLVIMLLFDPMCCLVLGWASCILDWLRFLGVHSWLLDTDASGQADNSDIGADLCGVPSYIDERSSSDRDELHGDVSGRRHESLTGCSDKQ